MSKKIAVVGATGLVGEKMIEVLQGKNIDVGDISFFASKSSAGQEIFFFGKKYSIKELTKDSFKNIDYALFALDGSLSKEFVPYAVKSGCTVIDNSSAFRMEEDIPLIVPEVNIKEAFNNKGIIANPNCSTIQCVVVLEPILKKFGLKRVIYNTYQSVSGSGKEGVNDLKRGILGEKPLLYPYPIANNVLPHIDDFTENGYTKEELKMINETRKILNKKDLLITSTAVRVPVSCGHAVSINIETESPFDLNEIRSLLGKKEGVVLMDDPLNLIYPKPLDAVGRDEVFVGRIRVDNSVKNGLNLWCVADNLRKGAASNAVGILEHLLQ